MWDKLGKLTGWLPGAGVGAIVGLLFSWWYWTGKATKSCELGISGIGIDCVHTAFGEFTSITAFATACMALFGLLGAAANFVTTQAKASKAPS